MFPVKIETLNGEKSPSFPTYLHLRLNDRFVPVGLAGDPVDEERYKKFSRMNGPEVWVPNGYLDAYKQYIALTEALRASEKSFDELPASKNSKPEQAVGAAPRKGMGGAGQLASEPEEVALVRDVIEDEELSPEEKAKLLSAVSQDTLRALKQITTRGEEARTEGLRKCKAITDQIIMVAAANSNIYDEILALRNSQEEIDHSVIVGTMAVMFGLAFGFSDETLLSDMAVAAVFHDVGLTRVRPELLAKHETTWTAAEKEESMLHIQASVDILMESGASFNPRVFRMILEHHENYDGSGFPAGLKGSQIEETSQILHLANLFDRYCVGKQTGEEMSPAEAFDQVYALSGQEGQPTELQPELVERIFQFMAREREAANEFRLEAKEMAEKAAKV